MNDTWLNWVPIILSGITILGIVVDKLFTRHRTRSEAKLNEADAGKSESEEELNNIKAAREVVSMFKEQMDAQQDEIRAMEGKAHRRDEKIINLEGRVEKQDCEISGLKGEIEKLKVRLRLMAQRLVDYYNKVKHNGEGIEPPEEWVYGLAEEEEH
ncbi:MAG: hypothetical protein K8R40_02345 [Anaerolineaceae bacterium]|nr:hypothetical protein [Anaerolineaceae bacterium]